MSMSDSIADLLTRLRNGYMAKHKKVTIPASNLKMAVAETLKRTGYIRDCQREKGEKFEQIVLTLKYPENGQRIIHEIKRVSKPSRRVYVGSDKIGKYKGGLGIQILSTSKGVVSDKEALEAGVGGEVLCTVW